MTLQRAESRQDQFADPRGPVSSAPDGITIFGLIAPLVERWRLLIFGMLLVGSLAVAVVVWKGEEYTAAMTLTTVTSKKQLPFGGSIAASYLNLAPDGVQATPALVVKLMRLDGVLLEVANTRAPGNPNLRLVQVIAKDPKSLATERAQVREIDKLFKTGIDQETGTITLQVTHADSAVSRAVATRLVDAVSRAFQRSARAQAEQQRLSLTARLDSASRTLQAAEVSQVQFSLNNRVVAPYSSAFIEQQRVTRQMQVATSVYMQALNDREAAVAKELEETPAVVIVDPITRTLSPNERHLGGVGLVSAIVGLLLAAAFVIFSDLLVNRSETAPDLVRLRAALHSFPRRSLNRG